MKKAGSLLRIFVWLTVLTGVIYPLFVTLIAQIFMPHNANGSFVSYAEKIVGSSLIGQKFESDKYFWSRPSAHDYDALQSGGSNFGPISKDLKLAIKERKQKLSDAHHADENTIPPSLLFASGSGLDPHLSILAVEFQMDRVAKARGISKDELAWIVRDAIIPQGWGLLGNECVNVLLLNLALDQHEQKSATNK